MARDFAVLTVFVVPGQGHEVSPGFLDAVGGKLFQQSAFPGAANGRSRVRVDIPGPTVQQAVVASGCAGIDILLFNQDRVHPAERQIPCQTGSGCAAADDQYPGFQSIATLVQNRFKSFINENSSIPQGLNDGEEMS
jgi:hypothetical protein